MSDAQPTLQELYSAWWDEEDDPPLITEADIHPEDAIAAEDALALEELAADAADARCLAGCPHFGRCDNWPY